MTTMTTIDPTDRALRIFGAKNDYSSRGNGTTTVRRVWRDGYWEWVSGPASRGRYRSADRNDKVCGYVYHGELVVQFTLGGAREPDAWYVVDVTDELPLRFAKAVRMRTGWLVTAQDGTELTVPDPYWR